MRILMALALLVVLLAPAALVLVLAPARLPRSTISAFEHDLLKGRGLPGDAIVPDRQWRGCIILAPSGQVAC